MLPLHDIAAAIAPLGLICRGGVLIEADDGCAPFRTLVMIGNAGPAMWHAFAGDVGPAERDAAAHPLDCWIRSRVGACARRLGADAVFPFDGPPFHPFLQWAQRAEAVFPTPIGPLIHPDFGLWHAYRAALLFAEPLELPAPMTGRSPCEGCAASPCRTACPVGAIGAGPYDVAACVRHLHAAAGSDCMTLGCRARRACPFGAPHHYHPDQIAFHMARFRAAHIPVPDAACTVDAATG